MSISTYAELKQAGLDWTKDGAEFSDFADTYIQLSEAYFRQELRLRDMEAQASITVDSNGEGDLPADFREFRRVNSVTNPVRDLEYLPPDVMQDYYPTTTGGFPQHYTIEGDKIRVRPVGDVTAYYYQTIPGLSDSVTTNWLLDRSPNLYLMATLTEHFQRRQDAENMAPAMQRRDMLMDTIRREDKGARWPNATARVKGITP